MEQPDSRITKKTTENLAFTSEYLYFLLIILISHHTHSHTSRFENQLIFLYDKITFSIIECGIRYLRSSSTDVLPVINCYQLLILVKNIPIIVIVPYGRHHHRNILLYVVNICFACKLKPRSMAGQYGMNEFYLYWYVLNIHIYFNPTRKMS